MKSRNAIVALATSWIGLGESDGSFRPIIDIYNKGRGKCPKMSYTMSWCATTISALAISLGYTDIIPVECSCGRMIEKAKKMGMGIWVENDAFRPNPGDIIMYDWNDSGKGDCTGWPDHVGLVAKIEGNTMTVIEGNKANKVGTRKISVNSRYIRGYITPKYDDGQTLTPVPVTPSEMLYRARIICTSLHVRNGAGKQYGHVKYVHKNAIVQIYEKKNGWGRIHHKNNEWISLNSNYVRKI